MLKIHDNIVVDVVRSNSCLYIYKWEGISIDVIHFEGCSVARILATRRKCGLWADGPVIIHLFCFPTIVITFFFIFCRTYLQTTLCFRGVYHSVNQFCNVTTSPEALKPISSIRAWIFIYLFASRGQNLLLLFFSLLHWLWCFVCFLLGSLYSHFYL